MSLTLVGLILATIAVATTIPGMWGRSYYAGMVFAIAMTVALGLVSIAMAEATYKKLRP